MPFAYALAGYAHSDLAYIFFDQTIKTYIDNGLQHTEESDALLSTAIDHFGQAIISLQQAQNQEAFNHTITSNSTLFD